MVWFQEDNYHDLYPSELRLRWDKSNLTVDETAKVRISVWGYREDTVNPKLEFIDLLAVGFRNSFQQIELNHRLIGFCKKNRPS